MPITKSGKRVRAPVWLWIAGIIVAPVVGYWSAWAVLQTSFGQQSPGRAVIFGFLMACAVIFWGPVSVGDRRKQRVVQERTDETVRWALEQGWRDVTHLGVPFASRGAPYNLSGGHTLEWCMRGVYRGREVTMQRYRVWKRKPGKSKFKEYTVTTVATDADVPATSVIPWEWSPERVKGTFEQFLPVTLESHEFNRRFMVNTMDQRTAHALFQPQVTARLLEPDVRSQCITWDANTILVARLGWHPSLQEFINQLDLVSDLASLLPSFTSVMYPRTDGLPLAYYELPMFAEVEWTRFEKVVMSCFATMLVVFPVVNFWFSPSNPEGAPRTGVVFAISSGVFLLVFIVAQQWRRRLQKRMWVDDVNALRKEREPY